jgi:hypothetical protein
MRAWIALLISTIFACSTMAETYFIRISGSDANTGLNASNAFATLEHFASIAQPGDTAYIGAGEHAGQVRFRTGGDVDQPIRIIGDQTGERTGDAGQVVLSHVSSSDMVRLTNADYHEFYNIHFEGGQESVRIDSSDGVVVQNCTFDDARDRAIGVINNGSVTVAGCDITSRKAGIRITNGSAIVMDSVIHDLSQDALFIQNSGSSIEARRVRIERVQRGAQTNNGSLTLINVLINGTSQEGVLTKNNTTLVMVNCTVNDIAKQGAKFRGTSTLYNNIFSNIGSHCMQLVRGKVTASHNLVYNRRGHRSNRFNSLEFEFDPEYADADAGDFSLVSDSEAKDIGRDTSSYTVFDINGFDRPSGEGFDLGAFETSPPPIYYVRTSGSDSQDGLTPNTAFQTIQHAVNSCTQAGSTVYVGPGIYQESVQIGHGSGANAVSGSDSTPTRVIADIQGVETNEDPGAVVLDGQSVRSIGIDMQSIESWVFEGFTITGQSQYALKGTGVGVTLTECNLNVPAGYGVHLESTGDVEISDCRFERTLSTGHAIWIRPTNRSQRTTIVVTRNDAGLRGDLYRASGLENGGGASISLRPPRGSSYGIFVTAASGPLIEELEISNNIISDCDVGIYASLNVTDPSKMRVMNNTVTGSYISMYVHPSSSRFFLTNNIISSCFYGAIVPYSSASSSPVRAHLEHSMTYNMASLGRSFEFDIITENPRFVDPENGDYSLIRNSAAVDAGYALYAPGVDINETSRPSDGNNDGIAAHNIGATESVVDGTSGVRVVKWRELGGSD